MSEDTRDSSTSDSHLERHAASGEVSASAPNGEQASHPGPGGGPAHRALMETMLGRFCDALRECIEPVLTPTRETTEALASSDEGPSRAILPQLREVTDQLQGLVHKIAEQQAYVLIFGPLKSGKSTFMNAICAKYVSEVTSLPAYPGLVQVGHAEEPHYRLTRYNGAEEVLTESDKLNREVAGEHETLVEILRRCEQEGVAFEPQQHAPNAIRRIDVRVPAGDLAQSGAVLVDTPGLYSRMKFGYDRLTREFRNAAACAIFVVKTDNLFLEQVFDEFQELLELFSRIFLIVNLDATKRDLKPDGSLEPSLEHEDPYSIVRAFENLSMSATLKEARADGRLRIHPVDLLGAASRRLRAAHGDEALEGDTAGAQAQAEFESLLHELTSYLNSDDYLRAFVGDSLRRGDTLLVELERLLADDSVDALQRRVTELRERQDTLGARGEALGRLREVDWSERLESHREPLLRTVAQRIEALRQETQSALDTAVEHWFEGDDSFAALLHEAINPALRRFREQAIQTVQSVLGERLLDSGLERDLSSDLRRYIEVATIDPKRVARAALAEVNLENGLSAPSPALKSDDLPVRRRFGDWLLMRGGSKVRQRLLGPIDTLDTPIAAGTKSKRLGPRARKGIQVRLFDVLAPMAARASNELASESLDTFLEAFSKHMREALDRVDSETREALTTAANERESAENVATQLRTLRGVTQPAIAEVRTLSQRFEETPADDLHRTAEATPRSSEA